MPRPITIARLCGIWPLTAGLIILPTWFLLRAEWLGVLGILTIMVGAVSVFAGVMFLALHLCEPWRSRAISRRHLVSQAIWVLALYFVDVLVAFGGWAVYISNVVTVTNESSAVLESVRVYGGGVDIELGDIAPGVSVRKWLWFDGEGELDLSATHRSKPIVVSVDGYVVDWRGNQYGVVFRADGSVAVDETR